MCCFCLFLGSKPKGIWQWITSMFINLNTFLRTFAPTVTVVAILVATWKFDHYFKIRDKTAQGLPTVAIDAMAKHEIEARDKLFTIEAPATPRKRLQREAKEIAWKDFIYSSLLNNPSVHWIYGAKRIGKSTLLQKYTFELQQRLKNDGVADETGSSNYQVFYINLETDADTIKDAQHLDSWIFWICKRNA